jgi:hypothetical protein
MSSRIEGFRKIIRLNRVVRLLGFIAVGLIVGLIFWRSRSVTGWFSRDQDSPEAVVEQYLANLYAQDYDRAYEFIASIDQSYKSRADYIQENGGGFTGFTLEAARQLASYIQYSTIQTEPGPDRLRLTVKFTMPDGNAPMVREILFAQLTSGGEPAGPDRQALLANLDQLQRSGQLPMLQGEQTFELVQEEVGWRILENWTEGIRVHFSGEVKADLPWAFEPVQAMIVSTPGQTLQTTYRVKNLADRPIVGKALHLDQPEAYLDYLQIVQCFCLIQQTLQPGEEREMPLIFRVEWNVPSEVTDFYVHYEFYPIESFPESKK